MVYLGLEPGVTGMKAQTNPLSYGGTPNKIFISLPCNEETLYSVMVDFFNYFLQAFKLFDTRSHLDGWIWFSSELDINHFPATAAGSFLFVTEPVKS